MRVLLAVAYALAFALPICASAASRPSVDAMFASMGMGSAWDASLVAMQASLAHQFGADDAGVQRSPEQQRQIDAAMARMWRLIQDEMSWQSVGPEVGQAYADVLSQEDIDALAAFYLSPAGRAVLAKAPQLVSASMQAGTFEYRDVLTPDEAAAFDAFLHGAAMRSVQAEFPQLRERMRQISQVHLAHIRPQMAQIIREMSAPAPSQAP